MQKIPLKLAEPGMILAKDAISSDNKILCGAGIVLTQEIIERLIRMNIGGVVVEGHPVHLEGEQTIKERLSDLEIRFSRVKNNPVLRAIMKIIAEHYINEEKT
jgi:hypothetical protein